MLNHLARLAAAVLVTAAAGVVVSAPADAAACAGSGVTVVVDFHELGGGVQQACAPDGGGRNASDLFTAAGFDLTRVQTQPGFVCRVRALPADDPCVRTPPANAFWSLWSSDGSSGTWSFASIGVDGLSVSDGGSVALSWKAGSGGEGSSQPGVAPSVRAAAPAPGATVAPPAPGNTTAPSTKKSSKVTKQKTGPPKPSTTAPSTTSSAAPNPTPSAAPSTGAATSSPLLATPTPSDTATSAPTPAETAASPSAPVAATTDDAATPRATPTTSDAPTSDDGGLPSFVAPVLVLLVFGAGGAVAVVRRRGQRLTR